MTKWQENIQQELREKKNRNINGAGEIESMADRSAFECILSVIDYILTPLLNDRFSLFLMCDLGAFLWLSTHLKEEILDFYHSLMSFLISKVILRMVLEASTGGIAHTFAYSRVNLPS